MKKTLLYTLFALLLSCSDTKKRFTLKTQKVRFAISEAGISGDRLFPFYLNNSSIIIFNEFQNSFSDLNLESGIFQNLKSYQDNPWFDEIPFSLFTSLESGNQLLINSKNIWIINENSFRKYPLKEMKVEGNFDGELSTYSFEINSGFGKHLTLWDKELLLILKEDGSHENQYLVKFNPEKPGNLYFTGKMSTDNINAQSITLKSGKMTLRNFVSPYISRPGKDILISYPFQNSFDAFDLKTGKFKTTNIQSNLFKNQKNIPSLLSEDLSKFQETLKLWNNDVAFGPILKAPQNELFFRIVKGESTGLYPIGGPLYLQLFNQDLQLIQEEIIPNLEENFLEEYFATPEAIYIKTTSSNEDELTYLKLIVGKIN